MHSATTTNVDDEGGKYTETACTFTHLVCLLDLHYDIYVGDIKNSGWHEQIGVNSRSVTTNGETVCVMCELHLNLHFVLHRRHARTCMYVDRSRYVSHAACTVTHRLPPTHPRRVV